MLTQTYMPALLDEQRDRLLDSFTVKLLKDPYIEVFWKLGQGEMREFFGSIMTSLSAYLEGEEAEVQHCLDVVGNTCFQLSVPLLETAYVLFLLRDKVVDLLSSGPNHNVAESERAGKFFDRLVLELLKRY